MILKNGLVFIEQSFQKVDVRIKDGKIQEIETTLEPNEAEEVRDCSGKRIIPGMVEVHSHGCLGHDFTVASPEELVEMKAYYGKHGTTSILATVMTDTKDHIKHAMTNLKPFITNKEEKAPEINGVRIMGINLEGPFFDSVKRGAHDETCLLPLDETFFNEINGLSGNNIRLLDIDPTLKDAIPFIEKFSKKMTVSLAHTICGYDLAEQAIKAGASHITHLFNGMNGLHHREPALIGAFSDFPVNGELICDGFHIQPPVIRMMYKVAGERIILISDSISPTGLADGNYVSGGLDITVKDGEARLANGTIAGSTITLLEGVRRIISYGISPEEAILGATIRPAKAVGIEDYVGSIEVGKYGDVLIVDSNYSLEDVIIGGEIQ